MGTASTPTTLRGLLVPDPRFTAAALDAGLSGATQAGPQPGVPVPSVDTEMVLQTSGSQEAGVSYDIELAYGGHPGSARYIWQRSDEPSGSWRGWDPPMSASSYTNISFSSTADKHRTPHALGLSDGRVAVAVCEDLQVVVVWIRSTDGTWAREEVFDYGAPFAGGVSMYPALWEAPDGTLHVFFYTYSAASGLWQIVQERRVDGSWSRSATFVLPEGLDAAGLTPGRFRMAYLGGALLMVLHAADLTANEDRLYQFVSTDGGCSFAQVCVVPGASRILPDVVAAGGYLWVAYARSNPGGAYVSVAAPYVKRLASAHENLANAEGSICQLSTDIFACGDSTGVGTTLTPTDLSLWVQGDQLYIAGRNHWDSGVYVRTASITHWTEWSAFGGNPNTAGDGMPAVYVGSTGAGVWDLSVAPVAGAALMIGCLQDLAGAGPTTLASVQLGGWTQLCVPRLDRSSPDEVDCTAWTNVWVPADEPGNVATWTAAGAGTDTLGADGLRVLTLAGNTRTYTSATAPSGTVNEGLLCLFQVRVVDGAVTVSLRTSDATPRQYEVSLGVETTGITLTDVAGGGSTVGTVATTAPALATGVQVAVSLQGSVCRAWWRKPPSDGNLSRGWSLVGSTTILGSLASNPGHRVRWGQGNSSDSYWSLFAYSHDEHTGSGLRGSTFADFFGARLTATPSYVDGGLHVAAVDGPGYVHDGWTVAPRYTYPLNNIHTEVAPSPQRPWRSLEDGGTESIVWDLRTGGGADEERLMGPLLGLHLAGVNFGSAELYVGDASRTFTKLCDLDLSTPGASVLTGLRWKRDGRTVTLNIPGGGNVPYYLPTNILAGSHLHLAGVGEGAETHRILGNSPGSWNPSNQTLQTRILLETEPSGANGNNGRLWTKDYTCVIPWEGVAAYLKIVIPPQVTSEGYYQVGALVVGHVHVFGSDYSWGRSQEWAANYELSQGRSGARSVRQLGPVRRSVEVSWSDGVDTSDVTRPSHDPAVLLGWPAGEPVATVHGTPYDTGGLFEQLSGAVTPVVYLPAIPLPGELEAPVHVTNRAVQLYSRVVSESLSLDTVMGDEWSGRGEILRVGTVRLEEEV